MLLRCATGEQNPTLGEWWTNFIAADPAGKDALMASAKTEIGNNPSSPTRRRRRRKPKSPTPPETSSS
jgi:poly(A) polymerase